MPAARMGRGTVTKALKLETPTLFLPQLEGHFRGGSGLASCSLTFPTRSEECRAQAVLHNPLTGAGGRAGGSVHTVGLERPGSSSH